MSEHLPLLPPHMCCDVGQQRGDEAGRVQRQHAQGGVHLTEGLQGEHVGHRVDGLRVLMGLQRGRGRGRGRGHNNKECKEDPMNGLLQGAINPQESAA